MWNSIGLSVIVSAPRLYVPRTHSGKGIDGWVAGKVATSETADFRLETRDFRSQSLISTTVRAERCVCTVSGRSFLLRYTFDSALSVALRSYFTTSKRR